MRVISPLDLRRSLGAILDAASAGERFLVERDRRPLAMLVSVEDGRRLDPDPGEARRRRLAALDRLEALAARTERAASPAAPRERVPARATPREPGSMLAAAAPAAPPPAVALPAAALGGGPSPSDRHQAERRRHTDEGLVGLG
jgi:antitoxin (DNA-binding transcriptional repressor) of toxin-antitoxin stability system